MRTLIFIVMLGIGTSLLAWSASNNGSHTADGWYVKDDRDTIRIYTNDKKAAKKLARKLNKIDKQDKEGVWDDGSEQCKDPLNEC